MRQELEQYSEMLALLDRQQQHIGARSADEVYQSIAPIKQQGLAIQKARARREECRAPLALSLQPAGGNDLCAIDASLCPRIAARSSARWCGRITSCWCASGQRARQNHLRLSRSIELMQGLINSLFPGARYRAFTTAAAT